MYEIQRYCRFCKAPLVSIRERRLGLCESCIGLRDDLRRQPVALRADAEKLHTVDHWRDILIAS
ncbi:MAG: hypothetical protein JXA58_05325 [Dehalococcoidia bacterium]|nr:hypothetical protein [Dehalococcoidia bacterium]